MTKGKKRTRLGSFSECQSTLGGENETQGVHSRAMASQPSYFIGDDRTKRRESAKKDDEGKPSKPDLDRRGGGRKTIKEAMLLLSHY